VWWHCERPCRDLMVTRRWPATKVALLSPFVRRIGCVSVSLVSTYVTGAERPVQETKRTMKKFSWRRTTVCRRARSEREKSTIGRAADSVLDDHSRLTRREPGFDVSI
jgi:hypothetical protein